MGWIDIKERMPKERESVLLTDGVETFEGYRDSNWSCGWSNQIGEPAYMFEDDDRITHWQPLPDPPGKEK